MNWTGGVLQRHSNTADSLKHRQQLHFARIKANLLNGGKKIPSKARDLDQLQAFHTSRRQPSVPSNEPRTSLLHDEEEFVLPRQQRAKSNAHRTLQEYANLSRHEGPLQQQTAVQIKLERIPDDDLYNATTPPPRVKREREAPNPVPNSEANFEEERSLSEKRRRILRKGDWVSVGFQRPPQCTFTDPKSKDIVGKRRKIADGHKPKFRKREKLQFQIVSPLVTKALLPAFQHGEEELRRKGKSDVKISIGGKAVQPGASSSSAHSNSRFTRVLQREPARPPSHSSDIMLLDNEVTPSSRNSYSARHYRSFAPLFQISPERRAQHSHRDSQGHTDSGRNQRLHALEILRTTSPLNIEAKTTPAQRPYFCSSSVDILHPKPNNSFNVSRLLQANTPEIAESTAAQIGRDKPAVPSSQIQEKKIWQTWVAALYPPVDNTIGNGELDHGIGIENHIISISPGISAAPTYAFANRSVDTGDTESVIMHEVLSAGPRNSELSNGAAAYESMNGSVDTGDMYYDDFDESSGSVEQLDRQKEMRESYSEEVSSLEDHPEPINGFDERLEDRVSELSPLSYASFKRPPSISPSIPETQTNEELREEDIFDSSENYYERLDDDFGEQSDPLSSNDLGPHPQVPAEAHPLNIKEQAPILRTEHSAEPNENEHDDLWEKIVFGSDGREADEFREPKTTSNHRDTESFAKATLAFHTSSHSSVLPTLEIDNNLDARFESTSHRQSSQRPATSAFDSEMANVGSSQVTTDLDSLHIPTNLHLPRTPLD